jgi:hypothetical protein
VYISGFSVDFHADVPGSVSQGRGWEPDALLNWLALAGWGVDQESQAQSRSAMAEPGHKARAAPDSTSIMTLSEMIPKVPCYQASYLPTQS